jgi:hypothetical protein
MASASSDSGPPEWQAARDVLDKFDERLHDLRKYGFSFITGLLSIDALFASILVGWKLAALLATLALIVSLNLVDRNYRVFQIAATIDAQLLERRNEMNLTQTTSRIYDDAHIKFFFQTVYIMFTLATLLLGWFILADHSYHLLLLAAFAVATYDFAWLLLYPGQSRGLGAGILTCALGALLCFSYFYSFVGPARTPAILYDITNISSLLSEKLRGPIHYHLTLLIMVAFATASILLIEKAVNVRPWVDFVIDAYEYEKGEDILVTVSNIGPEALTLPHDDGINPNVLSVHKESDTGMIEPLRIPDLVLSHDIVIPAGAMRNWAVSWSDHRWQFSTMNKDLKVPGLYRVVYNGPFYRRTGHLGFKLVDPIEFVYKLIDPTQKKPEGYDPWRFAQRFSITPKNKKAQTPLRVSINRPSV